MNIGPIGAKGESMVARFLANSGYTVVCRNYQCRFGEIDIVAEKDDLIVFVEVKTRIENSAVPIEEAVDAFKKKRLILTAEDFIIKSHSQKQPRFDVALVTKKKTGGYTLKYIENAI